MVQPSLFQDPESRVRIGPAGWSYPDWNGTVYPEPKPRGFDPLRYLAGWFDALEINSSFYSPPSPSMAGAWARRVELNPNFRFTAKVWKRLTHEGSNSSQDAGAFLEGIAPLVEAGRLGALLLQFPWSIKNNPEAREHMERLARHFRSFPLVVEVRHASWADADFYRFLQDRGIGFCNIDQPVIGQSLKPSSVVTSRVGYFRLHGRNYKNWFKEDAGRDNRYDYLYTSAELDHLSRLIQEVREASEECYVITNNHFRGQAVCNGLELQQRLAGKRVAAPSSLATEYPRLQSSSGGKEA